MSNFPGWTLDGRTYKTVSGLCTYLMRKHGGNGISGVRPDRSVSVYEGRTEVARYNVAPPELGKAMALELQ